MFLIFFYSLLLCFFYFNYFFSDKEKILLDIKSQEVKISSMPEAPKGKKIKKVELIIHLED